MLFTSTMEQDTVDPPFEDCKSSEKSEIPTKIEEGTKVRSELQNKCST